MTDTARPYIDGQIATWIDDRGEKQVAIRRDYQWKDGQWQVAIHGFRRVTDEFIAQHARIIDTSLWGEHRG